jgi:hypothetical protein
MTAAFKAANLADYNIRNESDYVCDVPLKDFPGFPSWEHTAPFIQLNEPALPGWGDFFKYHHFTPQYLPGTAKLALPPIG